MHPGYRVIITLLLISMTGLFAQEGDGGMDDIDAAKEKEPGTAFFMELGGKPFYSFNVDFKINRSNRISIGVQPVYGIIPNIMYYHLGKGRFELGAGFSGIIAFDESEDTKSDDFKGIMFHGVIGYRKQVKNGLLFRTGFTPVFFSNKVLPMAGVSFGYSL